MEIMKSFKLLIALFAVFFFNSCSEDDSTSPVDAESLLGTWTVISLNADSNVNTNLLQVPIQTSTTSVGENFNYDVTFTETEYTVVGGYDLITTGTINGIPTDFDPVSITDVSETGTYALNGNDITIDGNLYEFEADGISLSETSEQQVAQIAFNSNNELVMTQNVEETVNQDGIEFVVKIKAVSVWRKK